MLQTVDRGISSLRAIAVSLKGGSELNLSARIRPGFEGVHGTMLELCFKCGMHSKTLMKVLHKVKVYKVKQICFRDETL